MKDGGLVLVVLGLGLDGVKTGGSCFGGFFPLPFFEGEGGLGVEGLGVEGL